MIYTKQKAAKCVMCYIYTGDMHAKYKSNEEWKEKYLLASEKTCCVWMFSPMAAPW